MRRMGAGMRPKLLSQRVEVGHLGDEVRSSTASCFFFSSTFDAYTVVTVGETETPAPGCTSAAAPRPPGRTPPRRQRAPAEGRPQASRRRRGVPSCERHGPRRV